MDNTEIKKTEVKESNTVSREEFLELQKQMSELIKASKEKDLKISELENSNLEISNKYNNSLRAQNSLYEELNKRNALSINIEGNNDEVSKIKSFTSAEQIIDNALRKYCELNNLNYSDNIKLLD